MLGIDINAGCGQLKAELIRNRKEKVVGNLSSSLSSESRIDDNNNNNNNDNNGMNNVKDTAVIS